MNHQRVQRYKNFGKVPNISVKYFGILPNFNVSS
nr:MAG TPA: hypothetical protein [Caudoviricetes sp.]